MKGCVCHCGEDRRIPTLKEVFTEFPNMPINIDVKVPDDELYEKVNLLNPLTLSQTSTGIYISAEQVF